MSMPAGISLAKPSTAVFGWSPRSRMLPPSAGDADDQRRNGLLTDEEVGRVLEAAGDGGDVAEAEHFACRFDRRLGRGFSPPTAA